MRQRVVGQFETESARFLNHWQAARVYYPPSAFDLHSRGHFGSGVAPYRQVGQSSHHPTFKLTHSRQRFTNRVPPPSHRSSLLDAVRF
jgi:hypothetical protein